MATDAERAFLESQGVTLSPTAADSYVQYWAGQYGYDATAGGGTATTEPTQTDPVADSGPTSGATGATDTQPVENTDISTVVPRTTQVKALQTNVKSLDNTTASTTYTHTDGTTVSVTPQQKAALQEFYKADSILTQSEKDALLSKAFTDADAPQNNLSQFEDTDQFGGGGVQDDFIAAGSNFVEGTAATEQAGAGPTGLDPVANNAGPAGTVAPNPEGPNAPVANNDVLPPVTEKPDVQDTPGANPAPGPDPGQDPPQAPPQPGDAPPTDYIPPEGISNPPDLLKEFLESDPSLLFNHVLNGFRDGGASNVFLRWFGGQFNNFYGRYLGYVAEQALGGNVPTLSCMDFISSFDSTREFFRDSALLQRGDQSSRFASFASSAGAN